MTLGTMASDVEQRIDFDAMRKYKQERIQSQLREKDLGAVLCFDPDNVRYATRRRWESGIGTSSSAGA